MATPSRQRLETGAVAVATSAGHWGWTERIIVTWVVVVGVAVAAQGLGCVSLPQRERSPRLGMASHQVVNSMENFAPYLGIVRT